MIQLKISSGHLAGVVHDVRHFPFQIGRSPGNDLRLEEPGVWEQHLELTFDPTQGFVLTSLADALTTVNGWAIQSALLRNGDTIEIGSLKIRFWIGEARQASLRLQESLVWVAVLVATVAEISLLFWLLK